MQILGIIASNGSVLPNVTVTMYRSDEDSATIVKSVDGALKAGRKGHPAKMAWDKEFDLHSRRLHADGAEGARVFPLENPREVLGLSLHSRLKLKKVA